MRSTYRLRFLSLISSVIMFCLLSSAQAEMRSGEQLYEAACKICHQAGVAGAPKKGDEEWVLRVTNKGMDTLVNSVENGLNSMPAGGGCNDCAREEIINAIQYMLPQNMPM
jgi:cytochrome c5